MKPILVGQIWRTKRPEQNFVRTIKITGVGSVITYEPDNYGQGYAYRQRPLTEGTLRRSYELVP